MFVFLFLSCTVTSSIQSNEITHPAKRNIFLHFDGFPLDKEMTKTLRIGATLKEPCFYRDVANGGYKGIEYEILKALASKENFNLTFSILIDPATFDNRTLKWVKYVCIGGFLAHRM